MEYKMNQEVNVPEQWIAEDGKTVLQTYPRTKMTIVGIENGVNNKFRPDEEIYYLGPPLTMDCWIPKSVLDQYNP